MSSSVGMGGRAFTVFWKFREGSLGEGCSWGNFGYLIVLYAIEVMVAFKGVVTWSWKRRFGDLASNWQCNDLRNFKYVYFKRNNMAMHCDTKTKIKRLSTVHFISILGIIRKSTAFLAYIIYYAACICHSMLIPNARAMWFSQINLQLYPTPASAIRGSKRYNAIQGSPLTRFLVQYKIIILFQHGRYGPQ